MYRYTWFDYKNYTEDISVFGEKPKNWIESDSLKGIFVSAWEEHCLECAPPECYGNCKFWSKRFDEKCKKTHYGIKRRVDLLKNYHSAVQFKFMPWGKLETRIFSKQLSYKQYRNYDSFSSLLDRGSFFISKFFKRISPKCKIAGFAEFLKNKRFKYTSEFEKADHFLFQCFSNSTDEYNLVFEVIINGSICEKMALPIVKGYNQLFFATNPSLWGINGKPYIRIYPEKNIEAELIVFFSEFVVTNNSEYLDSLINQPSKHVKCVAWDLDNTIWNGVLIESRPENLSLKEDVLRTIIELDRRGIIQVIVSKNNYEDTIPILKDLGIYDYFVYCSINWYPKSVNLLELANILNININSFAFIDDSEFERGEVSTHIPNIRVYKDSIVKNLTCLPEFDVPVTEDSKNRRLMYQTEVKRKKLEGLYAGNNLGFLKSCDLRITIQMISNNSLKRSFELVQRTNQLNLSGKCYTEDSFKTLCFGQDNDCYVAFCSDKYGDYGQVGFFAVNHNDKSVNFIEYVMSCRVAAKWIEPALIQWIQKKYNLDVVKLIGINNKKNGLLIKTLEGFGFHNHSEGNNLIFVIKKTEMNWPEIVTVIDATDDY